MNITILGAGGFIGSHLMEHLVTRGERHPPDIRKLRNVGWEPVSDLRSTLKDAMAHYLSTSEEVVLPAVQVRAG